MGGHKLSAAERAIHALDSAQESTPTLSADARKILTFSGFMNSLAKLGKRARKGGDRDDMAAMNVELKVLKLASEIWSRVLEHQLDVEGTRAANSLTEELDRKEGNASTSFPANYNPAPQPDPRAH